MPPKRSTIPAMVLLLIFTIACLAYGTSSVLDLVDKYRAGEYVGRSERGGPLALLIMFIAGAFTFTRRLLSYRNREAARAAENAEDLWTR